MPRNVVVVDPHAKTVELHEIATGGPTLVDQIRDLIGCKLMSTVKPAPQTVLWLDNLGLLKGDSQRFWRMRDSVVRFAGRTVITSVDASGMPLPVDLDTRQFADAIDWCEGARVKRVWEELHVEMHATMGPWPRVVPMVEFEGEPPVTEDLVIIPSGGATETPQHRYWIVFEDDVADDFHCRERATTDDGQGDWTGEESRHESLDDVRAFAESRGMTFKLREKDDPAGVAGTLS